MKGLISDLRYVNIGKVDKAPLGIPRKDAEYIPVRLQNVRRVPPNNLSHTAGFVTAANFDRNRAKEDARDG
jgi:hypothetical protein